MRVIPIFAALALITLSSAALSATTRTRRFIITRNGGGLGIEEQERTILWRMGTRWFGERQYMSSNWCGLRQGNQCEAAVARQHAWIDGRTCPALGQSVAAFSSAWHNDLGAGTGFGQVASDTPKFTLRNFTGRTGTIPQHRLIEYLGSVTEWWNDFSIATASCWRNEAPTVRGRPLPSRVDRVALD